MSCKYEHQSVQRKAPERVFSLGEPLSRIEVSVSAHGKCVPMFCTLLYLDKHFPLNASLNSLHTSCEQCWQTLEKPSSYTTTLLPESCSFRKRCCEYVWHSHV